LVLVGISWSRFGNGGSWMVESQICRFNRQNTTRINLVHSGGFGVLLKSMLLVIWVLGMQGTMSLCMMLSSMLVMIMSMKGMAMWHFMMMSRFMMVT